MPIQTLSDTGNDYKITPKMDAAVYSLLPDCVIDGIGDELALSYSSNSLKVTIGTGQALIGGQFFRNSQPIDANASLVLDANSTKYLCLTIEPSNVPGSTGYLSFTATPREYNINSGKSGDNTRDYPIYKITTNSIGVVSAQDLRFILKGTKPLPQSELDAIPPSNRKRYIYIGYED